MPRTAINVYSVREIDESIEEIVERVADAGYDGIQFSGRHAPTNGDPESIAATIDERGLDVAPPHVGLDALQEDREAVLSTYEIVGADAVVVPWVPAERFDSAAAVDEFASEMDALADDLADEGWDLHYHNHDFEYVDFDGESGFERFLDATDVGVELDVGWALVGGDDPAERIRSLGDRASLVHMKDMDTSVERGFVEIGEGDVDMRACADAAEEVDAEWLIYEHDEPDDPAASLERGAAYLNSL